MLRGIIRLGSPWLLPALWLWRVGVVALGAIGFVMTSPDVAGVLPLLMVCLVFVGFSFALDRQGTSSGRADARDLLDFLRVTLH